MSRVVIDQNMCEINGGLFGLFFFPIRKLAPNCIVMNFIGSFIFAFWDPIFYSVVMVTYQFGNFSRMESST